MMLIVHYTISMVQHSSSVSAGLNGNMGGELRARKRDYRIASAWMIAALTATVRMFLLAMDSVASMVLWVYHQYLDISHPSHPQEIYVSTTTPPSQAQESSAFHLPPSQSSKVAVHREIDRSFTLGCAGTTMPSVAMTVVCALSCSCEHVYHLGVFSTSLIMFE